MQAIIGLKDKFSFRFVNSETLISEFKTGVRNRRGDYRRPPYYYGGLTNTEINASSTKSGAELRVIIDEAIFRIVYMNLSVVVVGPQVHIPLSFPG